MHIRTYMLLRPAKKNRWKDLSKTKTCSKNGQPGVSKKSDHPVLNLNIPIGIAAAPHHFLFFISKSQFLFSLKDRCRVFSPCNKIILTKRPTRNVTFVWGNTSAGTDGRKKSLGYSFVCSSSPLTFCLTHICIPYIPIPYMYTFYYYFLPFFTYGNFVNVHRSSSPPLLFASHLPTAEYIIILYCTAGGRGPPSKAP